MPLAVVPSGLLQIFAISHITYIKLRDRKTEMNRIPIPNINQSQQGLQQNVLLRDIFTNDRAYNKVLYDLFTMVTLVLLGVVSLTSRNIMNGISSKNYYEVSPFLFYYCTFASPIFVFFLFPASFYLFNPEVRIFIGRSLTCHQLRSSF